MTVLKKILPIVMILGIAACSKNEDVNIKFIDKHEFSQDEIANSCSLVSTIDGKTITSEMINGNEIYVDGKTIGCGVIDLNKIGENTTYFTYKDKKYPFNYAVKDTKAPLINAEDEIYIEPDSEFSIEDHISIIESDENYKYSIIGNVDTSVPARYEVKVSCSDSIGNNSEKNIWIQVGDGVDEYPISNQGSTEQRDPNAQNLIDEMGRLESVEMQEKSENTEVDEQEILEKIEVFDPDCVAGVYEIDADDGFSAANQIMQQYQCWQVEAKPINNQVVENSDDPEVVSGNRFSVTCICSKNKSTKDSGFLKYEQNILHTEVDEVENSGGGNDIE